MRKTPQLKAISAAVMCITLSGCGLFNSDSGMVEESSADYLKAKEFPELKIPEDYDEPTRGQILDIPPLTPTAATGKVGAELDVAPPVQVLTVGEGMRLMRVNQEPGIYLLRDKSSVEKALRDFLVERELEFKVVNGRFVTDWVTEDNETWWRSLFGTELPRFTRTRFAFQIGEGQQNGEVGLTATQVDSQLMPYSRDEWQPFDPNMKSATSFLNEFIGYLDYIDRRENAQRVAKLNRGFDVTLGRDANSNAALVAATDWRIAWAKTPAVLEPFGFVLNDKDQSTGTYFFQFTPNEPGFFAALMGADDSIALDLPEGGYQVVVGGKDSGPVTLTFIDPDGSPLNDGVTAKIYPYLSEAFGRNTGGRRR